ncbi:unnamed protein product [Schistosoma rodhaini]|uniref:Uncharacterized protein n=1 Tax=Schistosoma rodhaini TaxID=6188 RepID=A0AA85ELD7_9TREM|nr:unnamed protein product [Schistosoma rodhaini]
MTDCKHHSLKVRVIGLLVIMTVTLYLAVELNLFISDQYVFYSAVTEQGLPYYTKEERQRYKNISDLDKHKLKLAQKKAATLEAASNSVRITIGLITTLLVGYLSDRYGRRAAFGILIIGEILHIGITGLIVLLKLNLWLILIPGLLEAIFGGGLLSLFAQVATIQVDVCHLSKMHSTEKTDGKNVKSSDKQMWILFTIFDGIAALCVSAGSPIGGALIYHYGFQVAMFTSLGLLVPSLILIFCLPETHKNRSKIIALPDKQPIDEEKNDDLNDDTRSIQMEFEKTLTSKVTEAFQRVKTLDPVVTMILSMVLLGSVSALADLQYVAVYLMGPPFLWSPETVGLYSGVTDVTAALLSVICTVLIIKCDEKRKAKALTEQNATKHSQANLYTRQMNLLITVFAVSIIMLMVNRSVVGVAYRFQLPTANILIYIASIPRLTKSFLVPIIRTMLSISIHSSKQGFMQSIAAFVSRIGLLISFTALPAIYAGTVLTFPGTVFIIVVIIMLITLIIDLVLPLVMKKQNSKLKDDDELNNLHNVKEVEEGEETKSDNIPNYFGDAF